MKTDDYTDRMVWALRARGFEIRTIARLVGLTETDVMRVLAAGEPKKEEQRP